MTYHGAQQYVHKVSISMNTKWVRQCLPAVVSRPTFLEISFKKEEVIKAMALEFLRQLSTISIKYTLSPFLRHMLRDDFSALDVHI